MEDRGLLFEPIDIGGMRAPNRIVMAALYSNMASERGAVTQQLIDYLVERARGGVGLIILEATCVDWPVGKNGPNPLTIHDWRYIKGLHALAEAVHLEGAKVAPQLQHSGRQTSKRLSTEGQELVAPSPIPCMATGGDVPRELTPAEIAGIIEKYAQAALRARMAGCDAVEIQGSHGYLPTQFMSPLTNKRTDEYGGDFEGRMRFPVRVVEAIKGVCGPAFPVIVKLSGEEAAEGGLTAQDTAEIAARLEQAGADAFEISAGIYESQPCWHYRIFPNADLPEAVNASLARVVKQKVTVPVISVGKLGDPEMAVRVLREGMADLVALGRPLLADPHWPRKVREGRIPEVRPCIYCNEACIGNVGRVWTVSCEVNPQVGYEKAYAVHPAPRRKAALVVGGGPAGLEAARVLAERGHAVTLYEKGELGGQARLAGKLRLGRPVLRYLDYLCSEMERLKVEVHVGTEAGPALVERTQPDVLVCAVGAKWQSPIKQPLPQGVRALTAVEALQTTFAKTEPVVVVGGGLVGCQVAWHVAELGAAVTLVEGGQALAQDSNNITRVYMFNKMASSGVQTLLETRWVKSDEDGVLVRDPSGERRLEAHTTIVGQARPNAPALEGFQGLVDECYVVGDCQAPAGLLQAVHGAFHMARRV